MTRDELEVGMLVEFRAEHKSNAILLYKVSFQFDFSNGIVQQEMNKDLTNNGNIGSAWDIMKVWKIDTEALSFELVYDRVAEELDAIKYVRSVSDTDIDIEIGGVYEVNAIRGSMINFLDYIGTPRSRVFKEYTTATKEEYDNYMFIKDAPTIPSYTMAELSEKIGEEFVLIKE